MDLSYNLAELLVLAAYLFRKVLYIRTIAICASLLYINFSLKHHLPDVFWWSLIYICANAFQILMLLKEQFPTNLSLHLQEIKNKYFSKMTIADFRKLIKLSSQSKAELVNLITQGKPVDRLMLITKGTSYVSQGDKMISLEPYHFLGEMSFFNNNLATADVTIKEPIEFIYWDYEMVRKIEEKNP